jgi:hypothetical protein
LKTKPLRSTKHDWHDSALSSWQGLIAPSFKTFSHSFELISPGGRFGELSAGAAEPEAERRVMSEFNDCLCQKVRIAWLHQDRVYAMLEQPWK